MTKRAWNYSLISLITIRLHLHILLDLFNFLTWSIRNKTTGIVFKFFHESYWSIIIETEQWALTYKPQHSDMNKQTQHAATLRWSQLIEESTVSLKLTLLQAVSTLVFANKASWAPKHKNSSSPVQFKGIIECLKKVPVGGIFHSKTFAS